MPQRTFVMIDVVDSTSLTRNSHFGSDQEQRNRIYQERVNRPFKLQLSKVIAANKGSAFNDLGDALFLVFGSAIDAVRFAVDALKSFRAPPLPTIPGAFVHLHAGVHTGYAELDDAGNWQGDGVNTTARIESFAGTDQILISEHTKNICDIQDVIFRRHGPFFAR